MTLVKSNNTTIDESTEVTEKLMKKKNAIVKINELIDEEDEITLEDLAPDGGWGWMIALAMILIIITTVSPTSSFAIIFGDFLEESGSAGMATSFFNSVFMITFSTSSMMSNMLLKRYSVRPVGIMATLLFSILNVILSCVRNIYEMAFLFFLQGFGAGLIITICNTVFNSYFVKRRAKVMYVSQVIIALGGIIYPILTEKMMESYGFRGTAAIMGALSFNSVVGMIMMHPVKWHAKKPEQVLVERALAREKKYREHFLALSNRRSTIDKINVSSKTKWSSLHSLKEESDKEVLLLIESLKTPAHKIVSKSVLEGGVHGKPRSDSMRNSLTKDILTLSESSLVHLANCASGLGDTRQHYSMKKNEERQLDTDVQENADIEMLEKVQDDGKGKKEEAETGCKIILRELLDMSLIKNCCFMNLCFGVNFVCTADYAFSVLLPLMMTDIGYTKADAALTVMLSGTTELASKVLLASFTLLVNVQAKYLFFGATILMGFARIGFLLCEDTLMGSFTMIAIIGAVRSWLLVPLPLVIIEDINIEKFASAYGINSVIAGFVTIVFGAIVGFIKDWTNSYKMYQIALLVMNGTFIVPWAIQFFLVDFKKRRKQRDTIKNPPVAC